MGAEVTDMEVPVPEVAPRPDPGPVGGSMPAGLAGCCRCKMVVGALGLPQQRPAMGWTMPTPASPGIWVGAPARVGGEVTLADQPSGPGNL